METINEIINALKIIIPMGVVLRVIFCLIKIMYSDEDIGSYKRSIVYVVVFGIIAELSLGLKDMIMWYYG